MEESQSPESLPEEQNRQEQQSAAISSKTSGIDLQSLLLPGLMAASIEQALTSAAGNEYASGKFASAESSAALAVNSFGWFIDMPEQLPAFPGLDDLDWPAVRIQIERQMRFPWAGGRHPWLDAAVETPRNLIGVESKRFEPFRDFKDSTFSPAYDRPVWGKNMQPFENMRDRLRTGEKRYRYLDAVQLVKHGFGLVTEGVRSGKAPVLLYLYAEPTVRAGVPISAEAISNHRAEIADFSAAVAGAAVRFASCSYRDWLARFTGEATSHATAVLNRFSP